jgi:hypothetical protein
MACGKMTVMEEIPHGRPLAVDNNAKRASPTEPAFVARPEGAPVYHGFVVLDHVTVDGFTLGKITDWEAGALRNRRCVRDCAGRKPRRSCLGSLRSAIVSRGPED